MLDRVLELEWEGHGGLNLRDQLDGIYEEIAIRVILAAQSDVCDLQVRRLIRIVKLVRVGYFRPPGSGAGPDAPLETRGLSCK